MVHRSIVWLNVFCFGNLSVEPNCHLSSSHNHLVSSLISIMTNYTDIPIGKEQHGIISDNVSMNKDSKFYLKLACVGVLLAIAFMSCQSLGSTVLSLLSYARGPKRYAISSFRHDRFCKAGAIIPCITSEHTGVPECVQQGGGWFNCFPEWVANFLVPEFTENAPKDVFPNGFQPI